MAYKPDDSPLPEKYPLGECTVRECGCIVELDHEHDAGKVNYLFMCPVHTEDPGKP